MTSTARLLLGVLAIVAIGAGLVALTGHDPIAAALGLIDGAFGEAYTRSETLVTAIPLAIVAIGIVPALRAGVFTIGSEGQLAIGGLLGTAAIGILPSSTPAPWMLLAGALGGVAGGTVWALLPALLRAYGRANEILSTLLLNYVAAFLLLWSLRSWLSAPGAVPIPQSAPLPDAALIPKLVEGTRLHVGLVAVAIVAIGLAWWLRSPSGLRYRILSAHALLAARLGLSERRAVMTTMLFSGATAGFAGWLQVAGVAGTLYPTVAGGLGFAGILVALLGGLRPSGILVAALLFAALKTGADGLQAGSGIPSSISIVIQGLVLLVAALAFAGRARRIVVARPPEAA